MAENNAMTKEELKEIVAEMRQEFRQELRELRTETLARFEESDKKTASRFDEFEKKTAARFEESEKKTAARFEEFEKKTAARSEEMDKKTMARFDSADQKHDAVVKAVFALRHDFETKRQEDRETQSGLLTGMDKVMKELENHRIERMSLGEIQNRHTREIEAIQKHLGLESNNDKSRKNAPKKTTIKKK